jgi:hypothetical protein
MSLNHVKEVFTSSGPVSCVYLFTLGKVKDLRESMQIPENYNDEDMVCKYGYSTSLKRRFTEHQNKYGSINGADLRLKHYRYIDTGLLSKAETNIKSYMEKTNSRFNYSNCQELIIASEKDLNNSIKKHYDLVGNAHCVQSKDFVKTIQSLEHKIELLEMTHEKELLQKDIIIANLKSDNKLKDKDLKLKDQELINCQLKNELANLKLQSLLSKQKR